MEFASCSQCHCGVYQNPKGMDFRALFPTTFQIAQGEKGTKLPAHLLPVGHVNYENRLMDSADDLPKWEVWPGGKELNNDGTPKAKGEGTSAFAHAIEKGGTFQL
jgi:hypothetical protein